MMNPENIKSINDINVQGNDETVDDKDFVEEYVTKPMGAFGLYQCLAITAVSLLRLVAQWNALSMIFVNPVTEFSCVLLKNNVTDMKMNTCYEECLKYKYAQDVLDVTMITEFGLICERSWLSGLTQLAIMSGMFCGALLFGSVSDMFGRTKAIKISGILNIVFMFTAFLSPSYWTVTFCLLIIGISSGGIFSITTVYISEMIGITFTEIACFLAFIPFSMSIALLPLFTYFATTWRLFIMEYSIISLIIVFLVFFVPETPRWLITNQRREQIMNIIVQSAKINKLSAVEVNDIKIYQDLHLKGNSKDCSYFDLFRTKELLFKTFATVCIFFIAGLNYYGMNQYLSQNGSNLSASVVVLGLLQIPCGPIASLVTSYFGSKKAVFVFSVVSGILMVAVIFTPEKTFKTTAVGGFAMLSAGIAYSIIFVNLLEIYPSRLRNKVFSFCLTGSYLGAIVAPFIANIKPKWIPALVFGLIQILHVLYCLICTEKGSKPRNII